MTCCLVQWLLLCECFVTKEFACEKQRERRQSGQRPIRCRWLNWEIHYMPTICHVWCLHMRIYGWPLGLLIRCFPSHMLCVLGCLFISGISGFCVWFFFCWLLVMKWQNLSVFVGCVVLCCGENLDWTGPVFIFWSTSLPVHIYGYIRTLIRRSV